MTKRLFDTFRSILGRGMTQSEVDRINEAMQPDSPSEPEQSFHPKTTSAAGIALLHRFEGCARRRNDGKVEAYPDPGTGGEPWTIGWGSTRDGLHGFVKRGTVWTQKKCDERFADDLRKRYEPEVIAALGDSIANTSQAQFDALVSFHYNTGAIHRATLTRKHRAGDHAGAAREFAKWNKAGGRVMAGLTRRRAAEAAMYRSGM